jgi:hypothetical protein
MQHKGVQGHGVVATDGSVQQILQRQSHWISNGKGVDLLLYRWQE